MSAERQAARTPVGVEPRNGLLSEADLDERTRSVLATPRTANHHEAHRDPVAIDPAVR